MAGPKTFWIATCTMIAMADYSRLLEILGKLIGFRTVTHDLEAAEACFEYIKNLLDGYDLHINQYNSNGFNSFVISTRDTKNFAVLLQAHLDVVPAHEEQFHLEQQEGILYGRGVYDMKFAAACYLELLAELKDKAPDYNIGVMLTTDEEDGGKDGVEYLLNQGYTADVCVLPDSGDDWNIEASAKGYAVATVVTEGKSAHASRPWEAVNAADTLLATIRDIEHEFPFTAHLSDTVTLTVVQAGKAYNQIPDCAEACFDIRYVDETSYSAIKKQLRQVCSRSSATITFNAQAAAVRHDTDSVSFETWQAVTTKVTGVSPGFTHSFAASDARYFVPRGIPTVSTRPKGGGHHGAEEWLSEKSFYDFYEVIREFVLITARMD
jgi:succinyl-diaminopimelate desuccinylase